VKAKILLTTVLLILAHSFSFRCRYWRIGLTLLLLAMIGGCGEARKDRNIHDFVEEVKSRPQQSVEPIVRIRPLPEYQYPTEVRRDPFIAFQRNIEENQAAPDQARKREQLEVFPLDALHMVGLLQQNNQLWALIEDPNEVVHQVTIGNYIGLDYGQIIEITENSVNLVEAVMMLGSWEERVKVLKLEEKE